MDAAKKKKLEAKGWRVGSAADFLGLSDAEAELVDIKVKLAGALQERREKAGLSQAELAKKLKTSQPRVANMLAAHEVSLDLLVRALLVLGADTAEVGAVLTRRRHR
jgi:predicted XRE-type DNA-binding protein